MFIAIFTPVPFNDSLLEKDNDKFLIPEYLLIVKSRGCDAHPGIAGLKLLQKSQRSL